MDLGSGIRKKPIQDPGSRGQKGTGSRIRNTDFNSPYLIVNSVRSQFYTPTTKGKGCSGKISPIG
jgi:hypothetical protein